MWKLEELVKIGQVHFLYFQVVIVTAFTAFFVGVLCSVSRCVKQILYLTTRPYGNFSRYSLFLEFAVFEELDTVGDGTNAGSASAPSSSNSSAVIPSAQPPAPPTARDLLGMDATNAWNENTQAKTLVCILLCIISYLMCS